MSREPAPPPYGVPPTPSLLSEQANAIGGMAVRDANLLENSDFVFIESKPDSTGDDRSANPRRSITGTIATEWI